MKRFALILTVVALMVALGTTAFAANGNREGGQATLASGQGQGNRNARNAQNTSSWNCPNFVDTNNDGICDNWSDGQGQGNRNAQSARNAPGRNCPNFVDANNDGICDNRASGQGQGNRNAQNASGRNCPNFVDANNDGICDNRGDGQGATASGQTCPGNGRGGRCLRRGQQQP